MKKILSIAALAFILAACGTKDAGLCVDKFYENPVAFIGKEVTVAGKAQFCCHSGALQITGSEKHAITVVPAEGVAVPENAKCAVLKVTGVISEEVIDETFVATLTDEANATEDSTAKAELLAKAEKIKGIIVAEGVIRKYSISATAIETVQCDKKDAACDKKDGKACCKGDSTKVCCKGDSTKACCKSDSTKACCKKDHAKKCEDAAK
ncbi:MAG: hypothetical protein LBI89_00525 [Prevotellaceae bacterium]|jgi:hypothetical protein|nr:hypothetical protein [Prevotellaceae bacterium]